MNIKLWFKWVLSRNAPGKTVEHPITSFITCIDNMRPNRRTSIRNKDRWIALENISGVPITIVLEKKNKGFLIRFCGVKKYSLYKYLDKIFTDANFQAWLENFTIDVDKIIIHGLYNTNFVVDNTTPKFFIDAIYYDDDELTPLQTIRTAKSMGLQSVPVVSDKLSLYGETPKSLKKLLQTTIEMPVLHTIDSILVVNVKGKMRFVIENSDE